MAKGEPVGEVKKCPACGLEKPLTDFPSDASRRGGGRAGICGECSVKKTANWRVRNPQGNAKNIEHGRDVRRHALKVHMGVQGCKKCGVKTTALLTVHFPDTADEAKLKRMVHNRAAVESILAFAKSGTVLCLNDHAKARHKGA